MTPGKGWRRGKSKNYGVTPRNAIARRLRSDYALDKTWAAVGAKYGVSAGMAFRVADGYEPQAAAIRSKLGFPVLALVSVCPVHGVVHVTRRCPPTRQPAEDYATWKARNMPKLLEIVAWAESKL